jgi:glycosyltransferase involved in cell wall biosynthesis
MNILALTKYDTLGASSRMRMLQYSAVVESEGHSIKFSPLFSNSYVEELQQNKRHWLQVCVAYCKRIYLLITLRSVDILWIEKECLPWIPAWLETFLLSKSIPYIIDYDDAVFHLYDQHKNPLIRFCLTGKHPRLIQKASQVIVGNDYLFNYAATFRADNIHIIPTVIDLERYSLQTSSESIVKTDRICFGWIGQHSTAYNLQFLQGIFKTFLSEFNVSFSAIGINASVEGLSMQSIEWTAETEVQNLQKFDIGIMPLTDGLFEHGKCGYKIIQYMACGIPVIASPIGINTKIIQHGVNGFLASTESEWRDAMQTLILDDDLRRSMGDAGRKMIEQEYSLQVTSPKFIELLHNACSKKG